MNCTENFLEQRSVSKLSVKDQIGNVFRFCQPYGPVATVQICYLLKHNM